MSDFEYQIFLSYCSEDKDWAKKLANSLREKNVKIYIDKERLKPGYEWEPQLVNALRRSQHLVCLWSNASKESDWVTKEVSHFDVYRSQNAIEEFLENRSLIFLNLEGENKSYSRMEMINDLKEENSYMVAPAECPGHIWFNVMEKILRVINVDDSRVAIPVAIFCTTGDRLLELNPGEEYPFLGRLDELLKKVGIESQNSLSEFYGKRDNRWDWKPFGKNQTVKCLLESILEEISQDLVENNLIEKKFRWEFPIENCWDEEIGAMEKIEKVVKRLSTQPVVIVVDPLSIYDEQVRLRLELFDTCFNNPNAMLLALTPFPMPSQNEEYRNFLKVRLTRIFQSYYGQVLAGSNTSPQCYPFIADPLDLKRWLAQFFRPHFTPQTSKKSTFLKM